MKIKFADAEGRERLPNVGIAPEGDYAGRPDADDQIHPASVMAWRPLRRPDDLAADEAAGARASQDGNAFVRSPG